MPHFLKGRSTPSVRTSLTVLVVGCVLPLALVAWFLIVNFYDRERSQLTTNAIGRARALTLVVDREIATTQAALQALGTSNFLVNGDLDGFRSRAIEVLRNLQAENIVVVDATGQFLVSTRRPFGEPLQSLTNPALLKLRRILQTGKPGISDLFYGPIAGQPIFAISVPVQILGSTGYSLSATVSTTYLSSMLVERQFPPNWRGSIFDSSGTIVARTHDIEKFRGKKINQDVPQRIGTSNEGSFESFTLEGIPALIAYSRSSATQWMAIIGIPLDELTAGLRKTLVSLIAATVTSLTVGLLLAWVIGGRIARSITALVKPATALGFGEMVPMPKLQFREANELRQALLDAAATLHRSETARKQAEEGLHKADTLRRSILYGSNFIIVATDTKGVIQLFNVGAERMLGYSAADVVDKVTPADISDPEEAVARAKTLSGEFATSIVPGFDAMTFKASRGIEDMYEMTYIRKDGNRLPAVMSVTALRDTRDVIIGYMLTGTDNTARKDAEAAMRETDALLRTIHMHSIVSVTDRAGRIVDVNDSFCKISGYSRDELVGKTHRVVNSGVQSPEFWIDLWRNIASGKPWRGEICNRTKEGAL